MSVSKPEATFIICKLVGFGLMFALWLRHGATAGFFLFLFLIMMSLLRWRFPKLRATVLLDCIACFLLLPMWIYALYALILILFEGMYRRFYLTGPAGIVILYFAGYIDLALILLPALGALCGALLAQWEKECDKRLAQRDTGAGRYYELENLQSDLMTTLPQIERMTAVSERARIARDIHDNAGHEIVAAYISLQTVRGMLDNADTGALELYDAALKRLNSGVGKIRETAHNLQTVTNTGVEILLHACQEFPGCPVSFRSYGDTSRIPVYIWSTLEACLNESLTNATRHALASYISVELDATKHIVRFCVENDGAKGSSSSLGHGLRNLRHRAISIGGNLSIQAGDVFRVICVIPLLEENNESTTG